MTIQLSCGHTVKDLDDTVHIRIKSESICMFEGWVPVVEYRSVCKACYEERSKWEDYLIHSDAEEEEWLSNMSKH